MARHGTLILTIATACIIWGATGGQACAQTTFGGPQGRTLLSSRQFRGSGRVASLQDQLNFGLKARRAVEFQFISQVVQLVEQRKLPVKLVVETFHYARRKPSRYPFQYFQRALSIRAKRLGVTLKTV